MDPSPDPGEQAYRPERIGMAANRLHSASSGQTRMQTSAEHMGFSPVTPYPDGCARPSVQELRFFFGKP